MTRIIILNDFAYVNGGASQVALSSALGLAQADYDVTLFTAVQPIDSTLLNQTGLKVFCTEQHEILNDPNRLRASANGWWNQLAAQKFQALLKEFDPTDTVVHLHGWTKALSSSVVRAAVKHNFPLVCSLHDYFSACPNGAFFNYPQHNLCHLKALSPACWLSQCDARNYPQKLWRATRGVIQQSFGGLPTKIKTFITVSELSRALLKPYLPEDARIFRVDNPIDVAQFQPVDVAQNDKFLVVGRISEEKGGLLLDEFDGSQLVFVGDGPLRERIQTILPDAEITGWLPHPQVIEQLIKARAVIFPSLLYETQGLAVLEAAAMGIPAIVPDTCAAREWVEDGETGLWFRGGDKKDLWEKSRLLTNPNLAKKLGQAAFARYWEAPATMERHIRGLTDVYRRMVKSEDASA